MSALELVRFRFASTAAEGLEASTAWLEQQPGFQSRVTAQGSDGGVLDVVLWDDEASAHRAAAAFPQAGEVQPFLAAVDPHSVSMEHLAVVAQRRLADLHESCASALVQSEAFFAKSTSVLREEHSGFRPDPAMMSVAQQVAHVAITIDWFLGGVFGTGFDLDFERLDAEAAAFDSLAAARSRLADAFARARASFAEASVATLAGPIPANPIIPPKPRFTLAGSIADHTAHHRGALTVYSRLLGLVPEMPY